jgi:lysophospholipid acyltransferase (LPLAT)-like uncharacterized protein
MKPKIISHIVSFLLRFWNWTIRIQEIDIPPETENLLKQEGGFVLAGWHNQILSLTYHCSVYLQKKRKIKVTPLVSFSKDGEYIYETFLRFGMVSVRGSSSKGGAGGFRALLKTIKDRNVPIFTPDGPRGPIYKVQPGVVQIAQITGVPIVCFNSTYDRFHEFKSWDRHRFPKLFARQWITYSKPIFIPKENQENKDFVQELEAIMLEQVHSLETKKEKEKN